MLLSEVPRYVDKTHVKGHLISWHEENQPMGMQEGLINSLTRGKAKDIADYTLNPSRNILDLPLVSYKDIQPILKEMNYILGSQGRINTGRKWIIDSSSLELRGRNTYYTEDAVSETKEKYQGFEKGLVRRDTLNAYNEIKRNVKLKFFGENDNYDPEKNKGDICAVILRKPNNVN